MRRRKRKRNPSALGWLGITAAVLLGGYVAMRYGAFYTLASWARGLLPKGKE